MKIYVTRLERLNNGTKCVYTLTDGSVVIKHTNLLGKARFNFFDRRGSYVHKNKKREAMRKAVEHPKFWRLRR
ncbi:MULTISPECIES: hypothetical protein [Yersinia]|uniref:hypothetical protein n=1 Tax=Yersinia TaxID=629 RepID=UPI0011A39EBC|nr:MULTISPECIES: hypothetical protein [Yersinia]MBS0056918.1 hypothetical protein [Yersinia sp. Marseille-Q3913]